MRLLVALLACAFVFTAGTGTQKIRKHDAFYAITLGVSDSLAKAEVDTVAISLPDWLWHPDNGMESGAVLTNTTRTASVVDTVRVAIDTSADGVTWVGEESFADYEDSTATQMDFTMMGMWIRFRILNNQAGTAYDRKLKPTLHVLIPKQ